jgi:toxin CcdB
MAQFDVHRNSDPRTCKRQPFIVDLQSDFLSDLQTRVVVPLTKAESFGPPIKRLNPTFKIANRSLVLSTAELAGIDRRDLGESVGSLADSRDEIIAALDFLFTGI